MKSAIITLAVAVGCGLCQIVGTVHAAGVYEDAAGEAAFLSAPHKRALFPRIIRTNGADADASIFVLAANYPIRTYLLVGLEQTYISLARPSRIKTGFGDLLIRGRLRLFNRSGRAFRLTSTVRTGSGSIRLFPYASQSLDIGVGVGYVDTLETIQVRGSLGATLVKRAPEKLLPAEEHEDYLRFSAGITLPLKAGIGLDVGMTALAFRSGGAREIYSAAIEYTHSASTRLMCAVHAEAGKGEERVSDLALTAGMVVYY